MPLVLALLAMLVAAPAASAQYANRFNLETGDHIRIDGPLLLDHWVDAEVTSVGPLHFGFSVVDDPGLVYVRSYANVDTLEVREVSRRRSARGGALWGFYIGTAMGIIAGPFAANALSLDTGPAIGVVGGAIGLSGAIAGAVTGALINPGRWYRYVER